MTEKPIDLNLKKVRCLVEVTFWELMNGVAMLNKRYWYIWFSLIAFGVLWNDTVIEITVRRKKTGFLKDYKLFNLWIRALGRFDILLIGFLFAPLLILYCISICLASVFPIIYYIIPAILLIYVYFSGVYITYRLALWREKNLLINKDEGTEMHEEN